jgi:hypothetical protein
MMSEIMVICYILVGILLYFAPSIILLSFLAKAYIMDLIYLCGCNPNSTSSINGELPKTWLDQTNDEIRRFVLLACKETLKLEQNTTKVCGLPPVNVIEVAKPQNIKNIFGSVAFENLLEACNCSLMVSFPKERADIYPDNCLAYLRKDDEVIFTIHYYQDATGAWLLRKVQ